MQNTIKQLHQVIEYHAAGQLEQAHNLCLEILSQVPDQPDAIHFLGVIADSRGDYEFAKEYIGKAIKLMPDNPACYTNLGNVFQRQEEYSTALKYYQKALHLDSRNKMALNNIGAVYMKTGKLEQAISHLSSALNMDPDYVDAHWNLSLSLLLNGEIEQGFKEYEWRWKRTDISKRDIDDKTLWKGEPLNGKTILVYEEQGLGDAFQFVRYLPMLKDDGARIILEVSQPLMRLFSKLDCVDKLWVKSIRESTKDIDRFDFHIPILGLPSIHKSSIETIPLNVPYLTVHPAIVSSWGNWMMDVKGFRVGIVWAGNPNHKNDHNRSCLLSRFKELSDLPGVELISLQKEKYDKWTDVEPLSVVAQDMSEDLDDFTDTAAAIENLDLIISVDTAVVHLAGALGKKVWVLLPFLPDWRWMLDRTDSPWYPSMRLFRQKSRGDWSSVFKELKKELQEVAKGMLNISG